MIKNKCFVHSQHPKTGRFYFFTYRYVEQCISELGVGEIRMCKSDDLTNAVIERAQEIDGKKRLACAEAFRLSQELNAELAEIGRICNRQKIKICKCQLGCFS
jgi:hypothetical protein